MRAGTVLGVLLLSSAALAGCSGTDTTEVTGRIVTTDVYADHELAALGAAPSCDRHDVQVADGAGAVLHVGRSSMVSEDLQTVGSVHTLVCSSEYSFTVPSADVYDVAVPDVAEVEVAGNWKTTVNRSSSVVEVPDFKYVYVS